MSLVALKDVNKKVLLMGNEAIARGAVEAGVELVSAYPGTPSSEVVETLASLAGDFDYYVEWSTNEKVAFEIAAGAALVGARSIVVMKNAGLNVAMDTFMTIPYSGIKGGMVIVVADDPGAHYSSTEQDTRTAALYAEIPCMEPANPQEAKEMTKEAFKLSETLSVPVFLRSVTRLSHASGDVTLGKLGRPKKKLGFNKHWRIPYRWNVYGPPGPVSKHEWLHKQNAEAEIILADSEFNFTTLTKGGKTGIIAAGLGYGYAREALLELGLEEEVNLLKLGICNPLPAAKIKAFLAGKDTVVMIEEGDPVIEQKIYTFAQSAGLDIKIFGKGTRQILPPYGELNVDLVRTGLVQVLGLATESNTVRSCLKERISEMVVPRSSTLCAACPHLGSYWALKKALQGQKGVHIVNGDIGCYEQGGYGVFASGITPNNDDTRAYKILSPYEILDTIHVMGSGIGLALGQAQVGYKEGKILAVAGDSTFFHAVLPALVNASYTEADITLLVVDNAWTCMTGHQPNPTTGKSPTMGPAKRIDIGQVAVAMAIEFIKTVDPYNLEDARQAITEALHHRGPSVVILRRECALQVQRRAKFKDPETKVDTSKCTGCKECLQLGCPGLTFNGTDNVAGIDVLNCLDCGLCQQVCPFEAITMEGS